MKCKTYFKSTNFISTHLRTGTRIFTFINVFTRSIIYQFIATEIMNNILNIFWKMYVKFGIPFFAFTIKCGWCVDTNMLASTIFHLTFVDTTFSHRFILRIGTINFLITNLGIWYAHATATIKFCFWITITNWCCCI